jgi:predicted ArsR family transcriptional regulator
MSEDSTPGRKPRVTDEELLAVFQRTDDPVLSTAEIADELPIKRRATLTRLRRLADNGVLNRKQTGGRNTVWWPTTDPDTSAGGSAEPLLELVGLVSDESAQRVKERSREFRDDFNDRMDRRLREE